MGLRIDIRENSAPFRTAHDKHRFLNPFHFYPMNCQMLRSDP